MSGNGSRSDVMGTGEVDVGGKRFGGVRSGGGPGSGLRTEPTVWILSAGVAMAGGGGLWAALGGMAPAGWLAAAGAAVSLGGLLALSRRCAQWRAQGQAGVFAGWLLDNEDGPRLLTDAAGNAGFSNSAARIDWGGPGPLVALEGMLHGDLNGAESLERLSEAAARGLREEVDLPLVDPSAPTGEPEWARVMVSPGPKGSRLWSCRDVTARRVIDDVLLREREELADFLYFLPAGVYSADSEGRLRYVNQVFAQWLGAEPDQLDGRSLHDLMEEGPPEPDGAWEGRRRFLPLDDVPFVAEVRQAIFDDAGQIRTRSLVLRLPEAPEAVGGEGGWLRRRPWLFDSAPVGVALLDPEGVVTDCNAAFLLMMGRERDAVIDGPFAALFAVADQDDLASQVARVAGGRVPRAESDVRLAPGGAGSSGKETSVGLYLTPMTGPAGAGAPADGVVAHVIDTTEQKSLEQQFAQAQKMQAMGQLAGGVAHDFNNLLTAMIGFADLLLQRHGIGDPSFADIMQIKQNANRAANLVRQLLAFSRRQPLRPRLLSVTDALAELSHLLRRLLGERVSLRLAHGREPGYIKVDPGQFDQVIINLAVNARDAMPDGGVLTIATRSESVDQPVRQGAEEVPLGTYVVIDVTDTGTGISRENLARLFEPFFTTKAEGTAGAGTGLGLSTVYGIVRQTEGFIFVESALGQGATFTIYLPRYEAPADQAGRGGATLVSLPDGGDGRTHGDGAGGPGAGNGAGAGEGGEEPARDLSGQETILLVEDEDAVRVFGARALRNKGYTVLEARTGEGALELLGDGAHIDLLITDMVMPGMDGGTLAGKVREHRPDMKIILISGYSEDVIRGDVVNQPDTHFLPKPFSLKQLAEKVREVMA